jgi:hypothetical protein
VIEKNDAASSAASFDGAHQAGGACSQNNDIYGMHSGPQL